MWQRISREPNAIMGVVTSGIGLLVLFGIDVTKEQAAGVTVFLGAVFILIRFISTPSNEVVVQVKPGGEVVAGDAAVRRTGAELPVHGTTVQHVAVKPDLLKLEES